MTARHQIRIGSRRLGRERAAIDATPAPQLGDMLQLARERKGVDLFRAERDTKIRLKYLAALEDGHFQDLPAPVYTKGFLRNYAMYLALDPEEVLQRWRDEMIQLQGRKSVQRPTVAPPPRPISAPRRSVTFSAGWLMALLVMAAVLGFVAYIGMQLLRFADVPAVQLTDPPSLVSTVNAEHILLAGSSGPGALINIHGPNNQYLTATSDGSGQWSREVPLAPGRNDFSVIAFDPVTRRESAPIHIIVSVPLGVVAGSPSPDVSRPPELRLTLAGPSEGASLDPGEVTVRGTTNGGRVTISARSLDAPASPSASGEDHEYDLSVAAGGRFAQTVELASGRWEIVVTAYSSGLQPISQSRNLTVEQADEIVLVIEAARNDSWLRLVSDGTVVRGWGGPTLRRGSSVTVTAESEIWLRAGRPGALRITLNGVDLGSLGTNARASNWIIRPGTQPEQTSETR